MRASPYGWIGQLALTLAGLLSAAHASPSVDVALYAAFGAPPYLAELLETAADENPAAYFPLLDRIAEGHFDAAESDQDLYNLFLNTLQDDGLITDPETLSSFKFALSLHSLAPRIAAHYQYYNTSARALLKDEAECESWLAFQDKIYCTPDLSSETDKAPASAAAHSLPFDRVLGSVDSATPAVLYADLGSRSFRRFHKTIAEQSKNGKTSYRVRYKPPRDTEPRPLYVSGYGVELALKRTDYIVIDDREADVGGVVPNHQQAVLADDDATVLRPLSSKELKGLGLKAAAFVMASEDRLETLHRLVQDFPKHSGSIAGGEVSVLLKEEMELNAKAFLPPGYNGFWLNGVQILQRDLDPYTLLETLRKERGLVNKARQTGLKGGEFVALMSHTNITNANSAQEIQRYNWKDDGDGGDVIIWMNSIEKDKRYAQWPETVDTLLRGSYPGQLPSVRKDIHNVVVPLDLSNRTDAILLIDTIQEFVKRKIPIQFGIAPRVHTQEAEQHAQLLWSLCETYGLRVALNYLELLAGESVEISKQLSQERLVDAIEDRELRPGRVASSVEEIIADADLTARLERARQYLRRLDADGPSPPLFVNGAVLALDDVWIQAMSSQLGTDLRIVAQAVYSGSITDETYIPDTFIKTAANTRNALIIPENEKAVKHIDLSGLESDDGGLASVPSVPATPDGTEVGLVQLIVVADLNTPEGGQLLQAAVAFRKQHNHVELFFAHSGRTLKGVVDEHVRSILAANSEDKLDRLEALEIKIPAPDAATNPSTEKFWASIQPLVKATGVQSGQSALVLNGRVVGPFPDSTQFGPDDLNSLLEYETKKRIRPVDAALKALRMQDQASTPAAFAALANLVALSQISDVPEGIFEGPAYVRTSIADKLVFAETGFEIGSKETASVHAVVAIDPASEVAQQWIPVVKILSELEGVYVRVHLNPRERLEELPVKRFYRQVVKSSPTFTADGSLEEQSAHFTGLPADALLTIGMDLPPAWLVSPKESVHDLDNLRLASIKSEHVEAKYRLDHILVEGHSKETSAGSARGAQLILSTGNNDRVADTIIMSNLGYFQFKANPGYYDLSLQKGRSSEIFWIESAGASDGSSLEGSSTHLALTSFRGTTLFPILSRKEGMEEEDVLEPSKSAFEKTVDNIADTAGGVLSAIGVDGTGASKWISKASQKVAAYSGTLNGSKAVSTLPHADINIFSVASGHLYERMLNIMMVSVVKHTSHTVKFWFIEQFLSPSFKAFLPFLAEEYGFRYEMVTFKWPHWLRAQKEKQREIWGYKILFLDVLFPLDLDKVIFVDADQIVRTDMHELVQVDLQGAPYGFTPMCDSRTEMEGFRFWKQGYWKNFLRGLPYHISALYVVDLAKFRQMAAGDRLRQQYHQLSADPNSLSNLDQDLPNHMQHVLPIHSLPQEWLWCETWCSDASLGVAKTIDLCNNPQTKEPKLERARRQVPEWTVYDEEIAALARRKQGEEAALPGVGEGKGEQERLQIEEYRRKLDEEADQKRKRDEL